MGTPISVRMYRVFLGDCFLISIGEGTDAHHTLIDCGALQRTAGYPQRLRAAVADVQQTTGGRLDVLALTHLHWDHLSGFGDAKTLFDGFKVGQVWLPWTADPDNHLAANLAASLDRAIDAVARVAARKELGAAPEFRAGLEAILATNAADPAARTSTATIMAWLRKVAGQPHYWKPGQMAHLPGFRCYVLGPPTDPGKLSAMNPTESGQVYLSGGSPTLWEAVLCAASGAEPSRDALWGDTGEQSQPFAARLRQSEASPGLAQAYGSPASAWRQIDADWLAAVGPIAAAAENHVNNTSLALALEREDDDRVLLFPGDAQVGNWLSWHDLRFDVGGRSVTARDLLARTVLYKVGHHGSHNATLAKLGLELMTNPELVAMVPVETAVAKAQKAHWEMPQEHLREHLMIRARGRVILGDQDLPVTHPPQSTAAEWQEFLGKVSPSPISYTYHLS